MKTKKYINISILLIGVLFIIIGIKQNDYQDTLMKAIYICLECIGIG
ncbi:CD1871A family CXXC motif-containing protein [Miniphocaeibacter halophilus]